MCIRDRSPSARVLTYMPSPRLDRCRARLSTLSRLGTRGRNRARCNSTPRSRCDRPSSEEHRTDIGSVDNVHPHAGRNNHIMNEWAAFFFGADQSIDLDTISFCSVFPAVFTAGRCLRTSVVFIEIRNRCTRPGQNSRTSILWGGGDGVL